MADKFQTVLDRIKNGDFITQRELREYCKVLQDLLNDYNSMKGDYVSYQDLKAEYETEINKLQNELNAHYDTLQQEIKENERLKRALNWFERKGFDIKSILELGDEKPGVRIETMESWVNNNK